MMVIRLGTRGHRIRALRRGIRYHVGRISTVSAVGQRRSNVACVCTVDSQTTRPRYFSIVLEQTSIVLDLLRVMCNISILA